MRLYETTFIVNPQTDDATIDRQVQDVKDVITGNGGEIKHETRMGTRRLAYEINGLTQGFYTTVIYEGPPTVVAPLDRHFRLGEAYMRNLTVLFEGDLTRVTEPQPQRPEHANDRRDSRPRRPEPGSGPVGRRETAKPVKTEEAKSEEGEADAKAAEPVVETPKAAEEAPVEEKKADDAPTDEKEEL